MGIKKPGPLYSAESWCQYRDRPTGFLKQHHLAFWSNPWDTDEVCSAPGFESRVTDHLQSLTDEGEMPEEFWLANFTDPEAGGTVIFKSCNYLTTRCHLLAHFSEEEHM